MRTILYLYLLLLFLVTACVPSVSEPDWDSDTRMPADSTSNESVGFVISIKPWE